MAPKVCQFEKKTTTLSFIHSLWFADPFEVSVVWEGAREGSVITAAKQKLMTDNPADYKEPASGSASETIPVFRIPRSALVTAAMSSSFNFFVTPKDSENTMPGTKTITFDTVSGAQQKGLDEAAAMIKRDQDRAKQADAELMRIQRDSKNGRFKPLDSEDAKKGPAPGSGVAGPPPPSPPTTTAPVSNPDPTFAGFPSAGDQMSMQMAQHAESQRQFQLQALAKANASPQSLSMPMDTSEVPPVGDQIQNQINSRIPPPVAAGAPNPGAMTSGDPGLDKLINDPNLSGEHKDYLIKTALEARQKEMLLQQKLSQMGQEAAKFKEQAGASEKALNDYRKEAWESEVAFRRMVLNQANAKTEAELERQYASGAKDAEITSDTGKEAIKAHKQAVQEIRAARTQSSGLNEEGMKRLDMLRRANAQNQSVLAHSFTGPDTSVPIVSAGKQQQQPTKSMITFDTPLGGFGSSFGSGSGSGSMDLNPDGPALQQQQQDLGGGFDFKAAWLAEQTAKENAKKRPDLFHDPNDPISASRQSHTGFGSGWSSGGGSVDSRNPYAITWNQNVAMHREAKCIDDINARKLLNPTVPLPSDHPLVISASRKDIGWTPPPALNKQGKDEGWCPGLGPQYFSHATLTHVLGNGSDVTLDFDLPVRSGEDTGLLKFSTGAGGKRTRRN